MGLSMLSYGIQSMLKEGHKHLSGLEEVVLKNIDACKQLSIITCTSLDLDCMNKMVINHLDKLFATNDAATIVNELEVQHPATKILVLASKAQQEEIGDGANLTISFFGELFQNVEKLIRMGLHLSEIISGYTKTSSKAIEVLEELVEKGYENMDVRNTEQVVTRTKAVIASKQLGQEDILCSLIADVAMLASGVDTSATETKGTVLIHSAEQLENYAKIEEAKVEELIKALADSSAKVIVSGVIVKK